MPQVSRDQIEHALPRKGFVRKDGSHRYFHFLHKGRDTGIFTYTSHGSQYKAYGDSLLKLMRKQLRLDTMGETRDLLECPMDESQYAQKLKTKGLLK